MRQKRSSIWRKHKYGVTEDQYQDLLMKQNNSCAICQIPQAQLSKTLSVDHCHATGTVRGLLCDSCNRGLGYFKDNPTYLARANEYLKKD